MLEKPSSLHASDDSSAPNADSWRDEGRIRVSQWRQDFSFGLDFCIQKGEYIKKILIGLLGNEWKEKLNVNNFYNISYNNLQFKTYAWVFRTHITEIMKLIIINNINIKFVFICLIFHNCYTKI